MRKCLIMTIFVVLLQSFTTTAQTNREKIESLKVAFIAKELSLTPEEAQLFWPIYNEWQDKLETIKNRRKELKKALENPSHASEKEIENFLNTEYLLKLKETEYFKEYNEKLKRVIPLKKVVLLYKAEEEFKRELIKQLKEGK